MSNEDDLFHKSTSRSITSTNLSSHLTSLIRDKQTRLVRRPESSTELHFVNASPSKQPANKWYLHRAQLQTRNPTAHGRKVSKMQRDAQSRSSSTHNAFTSRWVTETQMQWISPQTFLGAGRVDPFSTYPVERTQAIDRLIDHCNRFPIHLSLDFQRQYNLTRLPIDASVITLAWPEEPDTGFSSLRTKWLPLCMQGEMIFKSMILAAEVNTRGNMGLYPW